MQTAALEQVAEPELQTDLENQRRTHLLKVAAGFFLDKGYSATSVDEIAEAAGTTGPALYRLFDSKQEILDSVCLKGMGVRTRDLDAAVARDYADVRDTLHALVKARIEFALGPWGSQVPITLADYKHLSPTAARRMDTASEIGTAEWLRCLVQIRPEAATKELLTIIHAVQMEITYVALYRKDLPPEIDLAKILQRIAMVGLLSKH